MNGFIGKSLEKMGMGDSLQMSYAYAVFRIIVGFNFMTHGAQKLLGTFGGVGGGTAPAFSLFWWAGVIELVGGTLVALGFFTRFAAIFGTISMLYAFLFVHLANGFFPIMNKGELAILFFASLLLIFVGGAGKWSLEKAFWGKEIF